MSASSDLRRSLRPFFDASLGGISAALLLMAASVALAADSPSAASIKNMAAAPAPGPKTAPKDPSVSSSVPQAGRGRPILRCWQEGKLVFEGSGMTPANQSSVSVELRSAARGGVAVQMFDLKSGLCMLDYGNEP